MYAFIQGYAAFKRGEPLSNCPRIADQKVMHEWRLGWLKAKKEGPDPEVLAELGARAGRH